MIGNGVVLDPGELIREMDRVEETGLHVTPDNLMVSLLHAYHHALSPCAGPGPRTEEGKTAIGTTAAGSAHATKTRRAVAEFGFTIF